MEDRLIVPGQPFNINHEESLLPVQDMRLAAALRVFRATLAKCPLEWVDIHKSRETFLRHLENPNDSTYQPKSQITWNFSSYPTKPKLIEAFYKSMEEADTEIELILNEIEPELRQQIREAMARLIMRACHETLIQREWLAAFARSVPESAKFDQIQHGHRIVRIGKRASPELRQRYLSKLPSEK